MSSAAVPTALSGNSEQNDGTSNNAMLLSLASVAENEQDLPSQKEMTMDQSAPDFAATAERSKHGEPQQDDEQTNDEPPLPTRSSNKNKQRIIPDKTMPLNSIRNCVCKNKLCRKIMTRWAHLKEHDRVGYLHVPEKIIQVTDTLTARHVNAFRQGLYKYLSKETFDTEETNRQICETDGDEETAETSSKKLKQLKDERIAYCHFHPKVIEHLLKDKEKYIKKRFRWRISCALGEEIGLKPDDMCPDPNEDDAMNYFALPNYSLNAAMADVLKAEEVYEARIRKIQSSQVKLTKSISANPQKYALEIHNLREENARLMAEVKVLKSKLKQEHGARCKAEEKKHSVDRKLTKTKCRLEKIVEAKKAPVPKGRPPKKTLEQYDEKELSQQTPVVPMFSQQLIPQVQVNRNSPYVAAHLPPVIHQNVIPQHIQQIPNRDAMGQQTQPSPNIEQYVHPNSTLLNETYPSDLTTHDDKWEYRFRQLAEYRARFMCTNVPRNWAKNKALGKWVSYAIDATVLVFRMIPYYAFYVSLSILPRLTISVKQIERVD